MVSEDGGRWWSIKTQTFMYTQPYRREYGEVNRTTRYCIRLVKRYTCYARCSSEQLLKFFDEFNMI